jgi:hypothetical protein
MSFQANFLSDIPCYAAAIHCVRQEYREFMSNVLICQAIKPLRHPKKGKTGAFLKFPVKFPGVHPCGETRKMGTVWPARSICRGLRGV